MLGIAMDFMRIDKYKNIYWGRDEISSKVELNLSCDNCERGSIAFTATRLLIQTRYFREFSTRT